MRATRLVRLVIELQRRQRATGRELAEVLGVSVRTIYRDVEALSLMDVPVYTESGPGGGIRLLDGYQTRLTGLSGDEASALGLAGVPELAAQLGLGSLLLAAQAKVDAALPPELRQRAMRLRERFHVDVPGWFERPADVSALAPTSGAVWDGRQIDVRYRTGDRTVTRRLHPLGLVAQGSTWYLVALPHADGAPGTAPRTYRVDRIEHVDLRPEPVERPSRFDLAAWWALHRAEFDRSIRPTVVRVRLPAGRARRLVQQLPGELAIEASAAVADALDVSGCDSGRPDDAATVEIELRVESVEVAHHQLLPWADDVEVLAPSDLRDRLAATGRALAARHAPPVALAGPSSTDRTIRQGRTATS